MNIYVLYSVRLRDKPGLLQSRLVLRKIVDGSVDAEAGPRVWYRWGTGSSPRILGVLLQTSGLGIRACWWQDGEDLLRRDYIYSYFSGTAELAGNFFIIILQSRVGILVIIIFFYKWVHWIKDLGFNKGDLISTEEVLKRGLILSDTTLCAQEGLLYTLL